VADYDLMNKTELTIRRIVLRDAELGQVADAVAEALGLERGDVLVTDVVGDQVVVDVLRRGVDPHLLLGRRDALQARLATVPGVTCTPETEFHSRGMLGWIALDADAGAEILRRSEAMATEIRRRLARTAVVFSTGAEVVGGSVKDTNAPLIRERLQAKGWSVSFGGALPDDEVLIAARLGQAADEGHALVLTTGGVGAEDKDRTIEALLRAAPGAATREVVKYQLGVGRHRHKDSVRIAVGRLGGTLLVALPGPTDEVQLALAALLEGLGAGASQEALADAIAAPLRERLRQRSAGPAHHHPTE
jgi:molybdenum cofactor synthesis domain-containing protein